MTQIPTIPESQVTPEKVYLNRRRFMQAGIVAATTVATGLIYRRLNGVSHVKVKTAALAEVTTSTAPAAEGFVAADAQTSLDDITHYNNFYEFSTDKEEVAEAAANFKTDGWQIEIGGLVNKPQRLSMDELMTIAPVEERIYRMRCVEAWSMVIPWAGIPLAKVLERVEPKSSAKYVAFTSLNDPGRMPGQRQAVLDWPYIEGLRMDEAMHPLALLATGIYRHALPPQDGAPVRLVVPWKYGFKGIKSIVKISLVEHQPPTTWGRAAPQEYGFYANVNPEVDHPRWSQAFERRIGEGQRPTLPFNGYAEQVAGLYKGMDLRLNF